MKKSDIIFFVCFFCLLFAFGSVFALDWAKIFLLRENTKSNINGYFSSSPEKIILGKETPRDLQRVKNFEDVKLEFISQNHDFIEINLPEMKLRLWRQGKTDEDLKIVARGNEPLWQGTPAGIYSLKNKIRAAFSVTEGVYMPYALQIYGSMWMHGIPYYPDGKKLNSFFSHGCVRLADKDIPIIFKKAELGITLLPIDMVRDRYLYKGQIHPILQTSEIATTSAALEMQIAQAIASSSREMVYSFLDLEFPEISAKSYIVADIKNDYVLAAKNATMTMPVHHLTKMMSALTVVENISLRRIIGLDEKILSLGEGETQGLEIGKRLHAIDLLIPMLRESSNDAAEALVAFQGREQSINMMNEKARSMLMNDSVFADPTGQSEKNISTALDMHYLNKYIFYNMSPLLKISAGRKFETLGDLKVRPEDYENRNIFAGHPNFAGGHVSLQGQGRDDGMFIFSFFDEDNNKRYISFVLLDSGDLRGDMEKIIGWIKDNYGLAFE
ncbi:MAG TPA: L,D-transpeptidase family protein [Candidatus Pacearchaeota archaeon]|nr:L,D-transpeptidase family protein [Candidatus Pacearchaeota archaeon]